MNLFETLDTYKTNPSNEIRKIEEILRRERDPDFYSVPFKEVFSYLFEKSEFCTHETSFDSFLKNIVGIDHRYKTDFDANNYRHLCELLLNLEKIPMKDSYVEAFGADFAQLEKMIFNGLDRMGYKLTKDSNKHIVTMKKDEAAEAIASTNKDYNKNIFDYLLAKTVDEKEKVITSLAIQLEATQPKDAYSKKNREFVQLPRHKDEKINDPKYSWFFEPNIYECNLDKLFGIYLSIISHDSCHDSLEEFKAKRGDK